jgi:hypothetical protein
LRSTVWYGSCLVWKPDWNETQRNSRTLGWFNLNVISELSLARIQVLPMQRQAQMACTVPASSVFAVGALKKKKKKNQPQGMKKIIRKSVKLWWEVRDVVRGHRDITTTNPNWVKRRSYLAGHADAGTRYLYVPR